jgi:purine-binding chemotaxis protein CheW
VVVDGVSDVVSVPVQDVKATPDFGTTINTEFIQGLATTDDRMVMLLDVDKLLTANELEEIESTA